MPRPTQQLAKFACLDCRTVMKREPLLPTHPAMRRAAQRPIEIRPCPACGGDSYWVGSNFRAPPKTDRKALDVAALLIRAGLPYCKVQAPLPLADLAALGIPARNVLSASYTIGPWPTTTADAHAFIHRYGRLALPFWRPGEPVPPF
jgi:hypothetical protein